MTPHLLPTTYRIRILILLKLRLMASMNTAACAVRWWPELPVAQGVDYR
jgi:hypothetical protein